MKCVWRRAQRRAEANKEPVGKRLSDPRDRISRGAGCGSRPYTPGGFSWRPSVCLSQEVGPGRWESGGKAKLRKSYEGPPPPPRRWLSTLRVECSGPGGARPPARWDEEDPDSSERDGVVGGRTVSIQARTSFLISSYREAKDTFWVASLCAKRRARPFLVVDAGGWWWPRKNLLGSVYFFTSGKAIDSSSPLLSVLCIF